MKNTYYINVTLGFDNEAINRVVASTSHSKKEAVALMNQTFNHLTSAFGNASVAINVEVYNHNGDVVKWVSN